MLWFPRSSSIFVAPASLEAGKGKKGKQLIEAAQREAGPAGRASHYWQSRALLSKRGELGDIILYRSY